MEKASTPRNRLTRSSAKQVNTPKNVEPEEPIEKEVKEIKRSERKTRRKTDSKPKSNGDTTNNGNNEDASEENLGDGSELEGVKELDPSKSSPKRTPSPKNYRRSLRTRRNSTSAQELDSSVKKMKRSSSSSKLDVNSTPTNKRGRRAQSESKDFVFSPKKDSLSNLNDANNEYIPGTAVRKIEIIEEVNEVEKLSDDEKDKNCEPKNEPVVLEAYENNIGSKHPENMSTNDENNTGSKHSENMSTNEVNSIQTDPSPHKKTQDSVNPTVNDTYKSPIKKETELCDITQNKSSLLDNDTDAKGSSTENIQSNVVAESKSPEFSSGPVESENPLNNTVVLEDNELLIIGESAKEANNCTSEGYVEDASIVGEISKEANNSMSECHVKEACSSSGSTQQVDNDKVTTDSPNSRVTKSLEVNMVDDNNEESKQPNADNILSVNDGGDENDEEFIKLDNDESGAKGEISEQLQSNMEVTVETDENIAQSFSNASDDQNKSVSVSECEPLEMVINDVHNKPETKFKNDVSEEIDLVISSDSEDNIINDNSVAMETLADGKVNIDDDQVNLSDRRNINLEEKCAKADIETKSEKDLGSNSANNSLTSSNPDISFVKHQETTFIIENSDCNTENMVELSNTQEVHVKPEETKCDMSIRGEEACESIVIDSVFSRTSDLVMEQSQVTAVESLTSQENSDAQHEQNDPLLGDNLPDIDKTFKGDVEEAANEKRLNNEPSLDFNDQASNESDIRSDDKSKFQSLNNYDRDNDDEKDDENYDEELDKSEDGSCDIYKGLSDDSGSYVDENEEGENDYFEDSSRMNDESGDSEYISEEEEEQEEQNENEKEGLLDNLGNESEDIKDKELVLSMDVEKPKERNPDSPMTYDKVLSIINKNRVKKIDDEEFFDMFTEELNRVSEKSGSDSDIAIVDEYLMEPEEASSKNQQKSGTSQNTKPTSRPGPASSKQHLPPENYPSDFIPPMYDQHGVALNQHRHPMPPHQSHPANFPQGPMYQQYDHSMQLRDHLMYNQYAQPSSSMQDPHMFNPSVHPDVSFGSGIYSHPHSLGSVSQPSFPTNTAPLKVRAMSDINTGQSVPSKKYSKSDLDPRDRRSFERQPDGDDDYSSRSSPATRDGSNRRNNDSDTDDREGFSNKKVKSKTPILDLLGLDEKTLKLLKKVLGLNTIERQLMNHDLEWQKKCLERSILKSKSQQYRRKNSYKRYRESDTSSQSSKSSDDSSASSGGFSKSRKNGSSSESNARKINIKDDSVFVTLKTGNKSWNEKIKPYKKKACYIESESSEAVRQIIGKKNRKRKRSEVGKKQPGVVKSQSGTFTVDTLTSQSSDSEAQSSTELLRLSTKMKMDRASGKNKLSNLFAQHSFRKPKESNKRAKEPFEEVKGPLKQSLKELRKLPTQILETLANEEKEKTMKRHRVEDSGSDSKVEAPKRSRKRARKMKVKSNVGDQNYIPCVTGGATEFGLSRLDKDGTLTLAETAAKFRTDHLYGSSVKRITSKELLNVKKKQSINQALAEKRSLKKKKGQK